MKQVLIIHEKLDGINLPALKALIEKARQIGFSVTLTGFQDDDLTQYYSTTAATILSPKDLGVKVSPFPHTLRRSFGIRQLPRLLGATFSFRRNIRSAGKLISMVAPDLVWIESSSLISFAIAARKMGIPVILHVTSPLAPGLIGIRRALFRGLIDRSVVRIIANNQATAAELKQSPRIRIIPEGIDLQTVEMSLPIPHLDTSTKKPIAILQSGDEDQVTSQTGQIWDEISYRYPDQHCIIITPKDKQRTALFGLIKIGEEKDFAGSTVSYSITGSLADRNSREIIASEQAEIASILKVCSLLIIPEFQPEMTESVLTAGALKRPVLASGDSIYREIIQNGETGLYLVNEEADILLDKIITLLEDDEGRVAMGDAAMQRVHTLNDLALNTRVMIGLITEILAAKS